MRTRHPLLLTAVALSLVAAACGKSTDDATMDHGAKTNAPPAASASRTIDVEMADIKFEPAAVSVKAGETVKFVFHNRGKVDHEALFGDQAAQDQHEKDMAGGADMGGGAMAMHTADAVTVKPGATAELTHTFSAAGETLIGCHQPGHYAAGMKITVATA